MEGTDQEGTDRVRDKPWRPADHPRPGPSWVEVQPEPASEQPGVPDAED
jgi:hypothetical protein